MSASSPVTTMEVDDNSVKEPTQSLRSNGDMNGSCDDGSLDTSPSPSSSHPPQDSVNSNDSSRFADIQKVPTSSEVPGDEPMEQGSEGEENGEEDGDLEEDAGISEGEDAGEEVDLQGEDGDDQGEEGDENTGDGQDDDDDDEHIEGGDATELQGNHVPEASIADSVEQAEFANGTEDDDEPEECDDAISINSGTSDEEGAPMESVNIGDSENSEDEGSDGDDALEIHSDYSNKNSTSNQHDDTSNDKHERDLKSADSGDVTLVENDHKSNGDVCSSPDVQEICDTSDDIVNLDDTPKKKKNSSPHAESIQPRRSSRNLNKQKSYIEPDDVAEIKSAKPQPTQTHDIDDDDIEEITPDDPLGLSDQVHNLVKDKPRPTSMSGGTIVVKDTKRLAEIANISKPSTPNQGGTGKKEPTLVIIDTNSILSGRGPVPVQHKQQSNTPNVSYSMLPIGLPAQGVYPPNMRATITPIPMQKQQTPNVVVQPNILPSLTDDMYVVEAPSFIVPYVYEKPPVKPLKEFVVQYGKEVEKVEEELRKKEEEEDDEKDSDEDKDDAPENGVDKKDEETKKSDTPKPEAPKSTNYFDNPLGKFFYNIGFNLVQEFVQTDLLKQQKRKRDREGNAPATQMAISSLVKNLEFSRENNEPYRMEMKKCDYCSFKTESALALAHHLETPHMRNFVYKCNFCPLEVRSPHDILFHMEAEHNTRGRLERAPAFHQCPNCPFEDNQKGKLSRHMIACAKKFKPEKNMEPPADWEPPAKIPRLSRGKQVALVPGASPYPTFTQNKNMPILPQRLATPNAQQAAALMRQRTQNNRTPNLIGKVPIRPGMIYRPNTPGQVLVPTTYQYGGNQIYTASGGSTTSTANRGSIPSKLVHQPSISITPLPRQSNSNQSPQAAAVAAAAAVPAMPMPSVKPGDPAAGKATFVICEICDGYIKDLEQLRNHMQWIHKVKIHPKMIYNRPPLNCQKCQFRFFTDQGLERHLLGSHGLVTSSMQEAANKGKDAGRCPVCGRVYQWKLLNHVARDHKITLKPAHLSYKCTVCTATFGMYKQFESHVYSAHSVVAKRVIEKKNNVQASRNSSDSLLKPLKINDEITIIAQPPKPKAGTSNRPE